MAYSPHKIAQQERIKTSLDPLTSHTLCQSFIDIENEYLFLCEIGL